MGNLVKSMKSWIVICLAACLVAVCASFTIVQSERAYADELTAGMFTQDLTLGARVVIVGVNSGQTISLEKGGPSKTFSAGSGTVTCEQEASGKIKVTLNNATIGATDSKTGVRMQVMQDWSEIASCPVELVVNGENAISSPSATSTLYNGITFSNTEKVTITGSGSLVFSNISTPFSWGKSSTKTSIDESGTLTINGPAIDASANTVGEKTTKDNAGKLSIDVRSGKLSCNRLFAYSYVQSGGTVEVSEGSSGGGLSSVSADEFTLSGGTFTTTGQLDGLYVKSFVMSGGTMTAVGKQSDALDVQDKLTISGGSVSVTGASDCFAIYTHESTKASVKPACLKSVKGFLGQGVSFNAGGSTYKVTAATPKSASKAATFNVTMINGANAKKMTVNSAKIGGVTYKVTAIGEKALAKKSNLATVVFGENVKKIGAQALAESAKAKVLTVKSKALTAKNVKNCLKGSKVNTVKVPAGKVGAYTKIFAPKNSGKKVTVKAI